MNTKKKIATTWLVCLHLLMLAGWLSGHSVDKNFLGFMCFMSCAFLMIETIFAIIVSVVIAVSVFAERSS